MPVLKQHHTQNFTVVPNALLLDRRLSFRDIGLLAWMLSKPEAWKFSYEGMLAERSTDGKAAMQAGVKSLQKAGYLKIEKTRNNGRLAESIWYVYDSPHIENRYVDNQLREQSKVNDSPYIEKPYTENPPQLKKYIKKENATPASGGGAQHSEYYKDPDSGEWRRKENT